MSALGNPAWASPARHTRPGLHLTLAAAVSLVAGELITLALAWPLPALLLDAGAARSLAVDERWWAEEFRGGRSLHRRHALWEQVDFRRIIFVGRPEARLPPSSPRPS